MTDSTQAGDSAESKAPAPPPGTRGFAQLLELSAILRGPGGCPWDREQTVDSLAPFLVEESYEALHATTEETREELYSELGDVAFVLALTLVTAHEEGSPDLDALLAQTDAKIRRRHPHVFEGKTAASAAELHRVWEERKRAEFAGQPGANAHETTTETHDTLANTAETSVDKRPAAASDYHLPKPAAALPGLARAQKLQHKAARFGFDWPEVEPVLAKVEEEVAELRAAVGENDPKAIEEELGDVLFSVVNASRSLGLDAEACLRRATQKFRDRFNHMIDLAEAQGKNPGSANLEELDHFWEQAKLREKTKRGDSG